MVWVIGWIILGIIAGFIASKIVNKTGEGMIGDLVLGVIGAVVGGWLFDELGIGGTNGFTFWSLLVAVIGAVIVLLIYHAVVGRRTI